ncbi:NAD-binding oxidoreductase [Corallococcus praedator]|uniref:NAD-binding oxidoreductase n=1 Tax=Corallococcus praedator TaxID=2316724 RepID=A0ABX9Q8E1_9BACT|nr:MULTISPECIES: NAD-binding oxidoreductase [Corallococcus]RKH13698.1 NAD-binding oxidoreductase [Corallococcus sp. CA047B]RKH20285.1 NAD-binding oxidoreductase [Corallococcus sp. CA031C]RKH92434.1 NAD-binding oxidoreductase [Corallococcus praedator]
MSDWHTATVGARAPAADGLTDLVLDLRGTALMGTHAHPGQYVRLRLPGQAPGMFAIASPPAPDGTHWEFLLKDDGALPSALLRLPMGTPVEVSRPEGPGFPMEKARGHDLLLFASGSGISAIRPVIASLHQERRAYGRVTLYFGARTPGSFAYARELERWQADDVRVVRTVSQPGASGWQGLTGYVQAHLGEEPLENAVAFVCGQAEMVQDVMAQLRLRGVPQSAVFLNY